VSLPRALAARIRRAAAEDRAALSAWLADAAEHKLLLRNAHRAIRAYERAHGPITDEELRKMERAWRG
jgi:hypothetical protein